MCMYIIVYLYVIVPSFKKQNAECDTIIRSFKDDINLRDLQVDLEEAK